MNQLNTASLLLNKKIKGHLPVTGLAVSDDGSVLITIPDQYQSRLYHQVCISASGETEEIDSFSVEKPSSTDCSANGRIFIAITTDDVYVFREGAKTRFFPDRRENYSSVSISASGDLFAIGAADMIVSGYSVTLARTANGPIWTKTLPLSVTKVQVSDDASRILVGTDEGTALMLDNTRDQIWELEGDDSITAVALTKGAELSIVGTESGVIQAIGPVGNRLWQIEGIGPVIDCAVSGDGKLIGAVRMPSEGGLVEFLCGDGTHVLDYELASRIVSVACSPNGRYAALSCEDGTLQVLDIILAPEKIRSSESAQSLHGEVVSDIELGDYDAAMQKLSKMLDASPCDLDACRKLIELKEECLMEHIAEVDKLESEGSHVEAFGKLREAFELAPYDKALFERLASMRERAISDSFERASKLAADGNLKDSIEHIRTIIRLDFTNLKAREGLGRLEDALVSQHISDADAAMASGETSRALEILEEAADLRPNQEVRDRLVKARARQAFEEGMAFYEAQRYSQAVAQFRKVLSIEPNNAEAARYLEYAENIHQDDALFDRFSKLE